MKAIKDRIIVRLEPPETSPLIADLQAYCNRGTVMAVGEQIIFHVFDEIPLPKKNWAVIREKSVLAILDC